MDAAGNRRRLLPLLLSCCLIAAVALTVARRGSAAGAGSSRVIVSSRRLPLSSNYTGLSVAGGRLLLIDYGNSPPRASRGGACRVADVDPRSLQLASVSNGACDNPALFGQHVMEVRQSYRGPITVRVATASSRASAGYTLGPALFTYDQCSDCWDESIAGPRSLWIYAPISTIGYKAVGELFRVSERTGRVLQHWRMPSMVRSLLAVDADGLWIASSIETGSPSALYHVAAGMKQPDRVLTIGTRKNPDLDARLLVAAGHTVWFETWMPEPGWSPRLYRLRGTAVTLNGRRVSGSTPCTDPGVGPATVLGNATGIYCVQIGNWTDGLGATSQRVFRLSPGQFHERHVATVTPPTGTVDVGSAADFDGSYYFLDPPTQEGGSHAGVVFRVRPG
jgi:hypothetical protein